MRRLVGSESLKASSICGCQQSVGRIKGVRNLFRCSVPDPFPGSQVPEGATTPGRWVNAVDLRIGDELQLRDGRIERIEHVRLYPFFDTVYNFEVEDLHCYAVGWSSILVHNANGVFEGRQQQFSFMDESPTQQQFGFMNEAPSSKPSILGPVRPYNEANKARTPGYDDHHLDPPLGRNDPNYPTGPTIRLRNDNAGGTVPGGVNLHTRAGGFQASLRQHITQDLGFSISQWNNLPDSVRIMHLKRYYASLGIPFPG